MGFSDKRKFILSSSSFANFEVTAASGQVEVYIGLNAEKLNLIDKNQAGGSFLWTAKSIGGLASIEIDPHDHNFHTSTFYYVLIKSTGDSDAPVSITLKQEKNVLFLANNNNQAFSSQSAFYNSATLFQKVQFDGFNTLSQQHVFQIPGTTTSTPQKWKVQIIIEALSDNFFPIVYLKRQEFKVKPDDLSELKFPTIIDYELQFG